MPCVRIDASHALHHNEMLAISQAVHSALVSVFGVPEDDRFQVVVLHPEGGVVLPRQFLGVSHSVSAVLVQIDCAPGRTRETKQALFAAIASTVAQTSSVPADDVIIHLVETARDNWSFGAGLAQLVP